MQATAWGTAWRQGSTTGTQTFQTRYTHGPNYWIWPRCGCDICHTVFIPILYCTRMLWTMLYMVTCSGDTTPHFFSLDSQEDGMDGAHCGTSVVNHPTPRLECSVDTRSAQGSCYGRKKSISGARNSKRKLMSSSGWWNSKSTGLGVIWNKCWVEYIKISCVPPNWQQPKAQSIVVILSFWSNGWSLWSWSKKIR